MRFSRRTESKRAEIFGEESVLSRIAYQANVLLLDTGIEVLRVVVRQSGVGQFVQNALDDIGAKWDIEVVLTAPNLGPQTVEYTVSSSDQENVPIDTGFDPAGPAPAQQAGKTMIDPVGVVPTAATMTVHGRRNVRAATITINPPPE
jgi:hypothetical protein